MTHIHKFRARVTLDEESVQEISVWDDYLTPTDSSTRPVREWVHEHLSDWDRKDFSDRLELLTNGSFELLFAGTIQGSFDHYTGEYDEEIDILESQTQELPN